MSRGGMYRTPDGQGWTHISFGVRAPLPCACARLPGDNPAFFGGRCARIGGRLCDGKVGETLDGKPITCDRSMCKQHATSGGRDIDYCPEHARLSPEPATPADGGAP